MLKQVFFGVGILIACTMNAMEVPTQDLVSMPAAEQKNCHLARLPTDIQNYIAFLAFECESEAEFIERTKIVEEVPFEYYKGYLRTFRKGIIKKTYDITAAFCHDKSKIVLIEQLHSQMNPVITIIELATKRVQYREEINKAASRMIALSQDGSMFANIQEAEQCTIVLMVKDITTQKLRFFIPEFFMKINSIDFNKQGTQIIVHGCNIKKIDIFQQASNLMEKSLSDHIIFSLTPDIDLRHKNKKPLDEYFMKRRICKNLINSIQHL